MRITVLLATVLLTTAIGQRFRIKAARIVFMILASLFALPPALAIAHPASHLMVLLRRLLTARGLFVQPIVVMGP